MVIRVTRHRLLLAAQLQVTIPDSVSTLGSAEFTAMALPPPSEEPPPRVWEASVKEGRRVRGVLLWQTAVLLPKLEAPLSLLEVELALAR